MEIDTSIGSVGDEFPELLNVLVDRTGFNPEHVAMWEQALESGHFDRANTLPVRELPSSETQVSSAHELGAASLIAASTADSDGNCSYAYVTGDAGALLASAEALFVWQVDHWSSASWPVDGTTPELVAASVGVVGGVVLGVTGEVDLIKVWGLGALPLLGSEITQEWIEEHRFDEVTFDDIIDVPGVGGGVSLYLVNFWGPPTFGPPAPDPAAAYHRLRIAALRMSVLGLDVTVDWGPFEQGYLADAVGADSTGEVFIYTMSADYFATGGGDLRNLDLSSDDQDSMELARSILGAFGLAR